MDDIFGYSGFKAEVVLRELDFIKKHHLKLGIGFFAEGFEDCYFVKMNKDAQFDIYIIRKHEMKNEIPTRFIYAECYYTTFRSFKKEAFECINNWNKKAILTAVNELCKYIKKMNIEANND